MKRVKRLTFLERIRRQIEKHPEPKRDEKEYTVGDFIRSVLEIDDIEDARLFRDGYYDSLRAQGKSDEEAKHLISSNIGWCFGEGMKQKNIEMWTKATSASHPVFGSMLGPGPTAEEAFEAGLRAGSGSR